MIRRVKLHFDNKIKGSLKLFADVMYSTAEFLLSVKVLPPYSNKWYNAS